jgi:hypothetical protein
VIINYESTDKGILLEWATGGEESIARVQLYRLDNSAGNKLVATFADSVKSYIDESTTADHVYRYSLVAVTEGGLASPSSPAVAIRAPARKIEQGVFLDFSAKISRDKRYIELQWKHTMKSVKEFQLYRSESATRPSLWKVLKGFESSVADNDVKINVHYEYIIRAILENGSHGAVAKTTIN